MIPQLPSGLDSTYTFTQSTPVSANAAWITFSLCLLVGWIAWCFAWAYIEERRADAKRMPLPWPSLTSYLPPEHPMCSSSEPSLVPPKKRREKTKLTKARNKT